MFERILKRFRERIRTRQFVMTMHAVEEMEDEGFTVLDVERAILTGKVVERQKEEKTGEWKYLVEGLAISADEIVVVARLSQTSKLVIITVYAA
jgi:hypothetical protein